MLRFGFILFALTYFFVRTSFAGEALIFDIHQQYLSTRSVGMGNAQTAVADDESAMFFNPAGLKQLKENKLNFFIKGGGSPDILKFSKDISNAGKDSQAINDVIVANYDKSFMLRAPSLGFIYARPEWSIAFIPADVTVNASLDQGVGPVVNLTAYQDTTLAFAKAWDLKSVKKGTFTYGVTSKLIYRAHLDKIIGITTIQNGKVLQASDSNEGMTLDFDVGAMWKAPESADGFWSYAKPTVGVTVHNLLDYGYFSNLGLYSKDKSGKPEKLHRVIDIGTAFQLPNWWLWSSKLAIDVRDLLHPYWTIKKGLHVGLEFNWEMFSWWKGGWRAGLNQGYWTAGFTGQLSVFKLDLATYGREVGTSSNKVQDRVYMFTTSLDF
ncbi:MAG: hypothetical protein H6623_04870 [Bdellovibrionaceae bacterium]|nr:hypothetical protein [Pseudobdellovibrionaceae bacterium]